MAYVHGVAKVGHDRLMELTTTIMLRKISNDMGREIDCVASILKMKEINR